MRRIGVFVAFVVLGLFALSGGARGSEGTVELNNHVAGSARCWASSVRMVDQTFQVLLSCRNIVYPADTDVFNYGVWASPADGSSAEFLGTVGVGKARFETKKPFSSLFVTIERSQKPSFPGSELVMSGAVRPIEFLAPDGPEEPELGTPAPTPVPTPKPARGVSRLIAGGGLAIIAGVAGIGALLWVITRR